MNSNMNRFKILLSFLIVLSACNSYQKKIKGTWCIEKIELIDGRSDKYKIFTNVIILNDDNTCTLPITNANQIRTDYESGKWTIDKRNGKYQLVISTKNTFFEGSYFLDTLYKEQGESGGFLDKIKLRSKKMILICSKQSF